MDHGGVARGAIAIASGVQAQPLQAISPEDLVLQLQRDKKPGGSRDSVFNRACAIAPRLLTEDDASEQVWSLQPLFLWQLESATVARINLYLLEADEQPIWSYEPAPDATQLAYDGEPLVPGQKYGWEVIVAANDPAPGQLNLSSGDDYGSFLVMATSERERIERDLVALEARLKAAAASPEPWRWSALITSQRKVFGQMRSENSMQSPIPRPNSLLPVSNCKH
ncbi:MAG: hypothetical protein HC838_09105 [Spirulinaceae cyanobacterium RM2_2_10]|nr:hypothetical protein [Spirulinaceae cyanobacterium RM2_2_10]